MEFMYCIPDLEVFIDKTIKKCLLEYDLDANDTEAVLDDMEKAWPKSPQKSPHENVTKDCNGNTENGRVSLDLFDTSKFEGAAFSDMRLDRITKDCHSVKTNNYSDSEERLNSNKDFSTRNGLVKSSPVGGDCSRSDTSSPDAGDGKLQKQRHSKLKSRLQQRYFEGSSPTAPPPQGAIHAGLYETGGSLAPNNLHLLASAANLHTRRSIGTGVDVAEASGYLKGQATMSLVYPATTKSLPKGSADELGSSIGLPARSELLSPLPSSSIRPEFHSSNGGTITAGLHHLPGVVTKKQESQATVSGLRFHDSEQAVFDGVQLLGHKTNGLSLKEKAKHCETVSSSDLKALENPGFPNGNGIMRIHCSEEEEVSRVLPDNACPSTEEKARRLFELYQKGYHSVIPRDVLVVREELSPSSEITYLADKKIIPRLSSNSQKGSLEVKQMKRRLSPSSDGGHFQNKYTVKQLSRSEISDFDFRKKRQSSPGSGNRDLGVKRMRKQQPCFPNDGGLEVRKGHNQEEVRHSSSSLTTSDQRPVSAPNYYPLASHTNGLEYTHQHSYGLKPGGFFNQQHYYTSRIASIIVEELEKDIQCQPEVVPTNIPLAHKLSPDIPPYFGPNDSISSGLKSNNNLPCNFQFSPAQIKKSISFTNDGYPYLENIPKSVPQILPAHTARPSHNSLSALLAFNLGHSADVNDYKVKASFCDLDKSGAVRDDNIQPEDLSIRSNNNVQNQVRPVNHMSAKSSPHWAAVDDQSYGYFSSPTSPVITSQLVCHTQPSQVLHKPSSSPSSSPLHNHKKEIKYSSDSEAATTSQKTLGNWEKKGQVHGLGIASKGNSKAVEKRRAETLKTCSASGQGHMRKSKTPQSDTMISQLQS